jgi:hypothetical protein
MQWAGNVVHMEEEEECIQGFDGENGKKVITWKI